MVCAVASSHLTVLIKGVDITYATSQTRIQHDPSIEDSPRSSGGYRHPAGYPAPPGPGGYNPYGDDPSRAPANYMQGTYAPHTGFPQQGEYGAGHYTMAPQGGAIPAPDRGGFPPGGQGQPHYVYGQPPLPGAQPPNAYFPPF